jgi:Spx/MgsR family transcriptional regulator
MIKIYGIKNCDSVKKALSFFKKHDLAYELQDFKVDPVTCEKIAFWLESAQLKQLFNARSTTYRNLKLKEKNLSPREQIKYLCEENLLIKRPVIEFNDTVTIGFNEDNFKGTFL